MHAMNRRFIIFGYDELDFIFPKLSIHSSFYVFFVFLILKEIFVTDLRTQKARIKFLFQRHMHVQDRAGARISILIAIFCLKKALLIRHAQLR